MAKKQSEELTANGKSKRLLVPSDSSNVYAWGTFGGATLTFNVVWNNLITGENEFFPLTDCDGNVFTLTEDTGPIPLRVSGGTSMECEVSGATATTALFWGVR